MDVEQIELLPCPFCGGRAKLHERTERQNFSDADATYSGMGQSAGSIEHTIREIHCGCGVRVSGFRVSELWNNRAALTPPEGYVLVPVDTLEEITYYAEGYVSTHEFVLMKKDRKMLHVRKAQEILSSRSEVKP